MPLNDAVHKVTERIRILPTAYIQRMVRAACAGPARSHFSCGNLALACAGGPEADKTHRTGSAAGSIGIVTAYNDMLTTHQPFEGLPALIREAAREAGGTAQVAGGVPAMCDGVTRGRAGHGVLALRSRCDRTRDGRDAITQLLRRCDLIGICDQIVPGLVIVAATFGCIPATYVPAGPMTSGLSNDEKAAVHQRFARGEIGRDELMAAELASYHGADTCTFHGTANSNRMLMEFMGPILPGVIFINPGTPSREALARAAASRAFEITATGNACMPVSAELDERTIVNGMVGRHATDGSNNLTLHLVAMVRGAGVSIDWTDMIEFYAVTPLSARFKLNGPGEVNHFHVAGGPRLPCGAAHRRAHARRVGQVSPAIHVTPEAAAGWAIARVRAGACRSFGQWLRHRA